MLLIFKIWKVFIHHRCHSLQAPKIADNSKEGGLVIPVVEQLRDQGCFVCLFSWVSCLRDWAGIDIVCELLGLIPAVQCRKKMHSFVVLFQRIVGKTSLSFRWMGVWWKGSGVYWHWSAAAWVYNEEWSSNKESCGINWIEGKHLSATGFQNFSPAPDCHQIAVVKTSVFKYWNFLFAHSV